MKQTADQKKICIRLLYASSPPTQAGPCQPPPQGGGRETPAEEETVQPWEASLADKEEPGGGRFGYIQ